MKKTQGRAVVQLYLLLGVALSATPSCAEPLAPTTALDVTGGLNVVIHQKNNFGAEEAARLEAARIALQKVLNTEEFKQRVLHFTYGGEETFYQNNGLTNLEIYQQIIAAAEQYPQPTQPNHTIDLYTELYHEDSNVVGYTNPGTAIIFMNSNFFNKAAPSGSAANLMHEWMHKLGFDHDAEATEERPYSVPYAIGDIAEELAAK